MKKYLALFLCLCMMVALCSTMALAEEPAEEAEEAALIADPLDIRFLSIHLLT